jgi:atypical dual specificity phosphatase
VLRASGSHGCEILDKCCVRALDRRALLALAFEPAGAVCVYFAAEAEQCVARVGARVDHPTILFGRGASAVREMAARLEPPSAAEGFAEVVTLRAPADVDALLRRWGVPPLVVAPAGFAKFPRTRHVLDAGGHGVGRDDLLMGGADAARFFDGESVVSVEEKVDGANLGLSLTAGYELRAQNRAHYVTSESAPQFRALGGWLDAHGWALCALLKPDDEILFGEWVYARHSLGYARLPGFFLAFDLYSKRTNAFASRDELRARLAGLPIPTVRELARRPFASAAELLALLESESAYTAEGGKVEGVYLRIDGERPARGKIVRPDFAQAIAAHWQARPLERNSLARGDEAEAEAEG